MIKMKAGGIILTGVAAFVVCGKLIDIAKTTVSDACEASKWRGYYKCWSKGKATGEPVPPGYSMTVRPDKADYEVVFDPEGKDHANDNLQEEPKKSMSTDAVKTVCETAKTIVEKVINDLSGKKQAPEEAKESETENDIPVTTYEEAIENAFDGNEEEKETDQDETVD